MGSLRTCYGPLFLLSYCLSGTRYGVRPDRSPGQVPTTQEIIRELLTMTPVALSAPDPATPGPAHRVVNCDLRGNLRVCPATQCHRAQRLPSLTSPTVHPVPLAPAHCPRQTHLSSQGARSPLPRALPILCTLHRSISLFSRHYLKAYSRTRCPYCSLLSKDTPHPGTPSWLLPVPPARHTRPL